MADAEAATSWSKSDARFWRNRLFKRQGDDWHVRIAFKGIQERFPLHTPNAAAAAGKARDIWTSLQTVGWEQTRNRFKPWRVDSQSDDSPLTVGAYIEAARAAALVRATTFQCYERKFRFLVAQIAAIKSTKRKHDYVTGGHLQFRTDVGSVPLASITPDVVTRWRVAYLQRHGKNPIELNHARQSAASIIRNSKALFAPRVVRNLALNLPSPLPFEGMEIGKLPRTRYTSRINLPLLATQAQKELAEQPEAWKIFLLATCAGLRRGEIDTLTWRQFDWQGGRLRIEVTEYGSLKTESSAEVLDLAPGIVAEFQGFFQRSKDKFVVASAVDPRPAAHWKHYRCAGHFRALIDWLRSKGVKERNPIHTLRKEFGTRINQQFGIFAASAALRHSSITLTREHYVDRKERIAIDLSDITKGVK